MNKRIRSNYKYIEFQNFVCENIVKRLRANILNESKKERRILFDYALISRLGDNDLLFIRNIMNI